MSFGGRSNVPWGRNAMHGHSQSGGFYQSSQQMFMQNAQQDNMMEYMFSSGGGNSVSYPQRRSGLNPVAFQQGGGGQSHYNSIGTVTKISSDFGLINDEIFFDRNVCKGPVPKLGDRVIFESAFCSSGQFKWNATRVQLMQQAVMGLSSIAPMNDYQHGEIPFNAAKRSPIRGGGGRYGSGRYDRERLYQGRDRLEDEHGRKKRREDRVNNRRAGAGVRSERTERERDRGISRNKEREHTDRDKEINRAVSKERRGRQVRRYMVHIPKVLLVHKSADVQDLRQRYTSLYIPSDFFHASIKWCDTFTPDNPFSLRRPCQFHIMPKNIDPPIEQSPDLLEPADANYLYSAKVMLLALPTIADIYKKSFDSEHPSRSINFLVGVRGRNEPMAIGGPWSPSLDGENPDKDPTVLIRTAIRTCKALTGVDLSNCTQWYRFVELYYHRTEYKNMEKDGPPRVETIVIYLPDVHSCLPSIEEWQTLSQVYKNAADNVIASRKALIDAKAKATAAENSNDDNEKTNDVDMLDNTKLADVKSEDKKPENNKSSMETAENNVKEEVEEEDATNSINDEATNADDIDSAVVAEDVDVDNADANVDDVADDKQNNDVNAAEAAAADDENEEPAPEPTHYSLLDLETMKTQEIRDELLVRNLPHKGVRSVVTAGLLMALNAEKAEEEAKNKGKKAPPKAVAAKKTTKIEDKKTTNANKKKQEKKAVIKSKGKDEKSKVKTSTGKKTSVKAKNLKDEDLEMNNTVALDEEKTLREFNEKEKSELIRRYTLPSNPQMIVHPNKKAKDGNFDCAIMSLSILLDYHPDDNKERFFEVFLFAELFNEMLMRDFAFNIYKEIYLYEDNSNSNNSNGDITDVKVEEETKKPTSNEVKEEIKDQEKEVEVKENDDDDDDDENDKSCKKAIKSSTSANEMNSTEKPTKDETNEEAQSIKSESRKRKLSTSTTSTSNVKDRESTAAATAIEKKMVVVKPQLLLSFLYFDVSQCGYIFEKHLEDLFTVMGLNLSRAQIKTVLGKLPTREAIYYRKLTDKEESLDSTPCLEDVDDLPIEILKQISAGNNQYEAVFGKHNESPQVSVIGEEENKDGLINFNGTVVHVGKLLTQIKRTEKKYSDLEKLYNDLLKQQSDLQRDHNKSSTKIKDLQAEIKNVSSKLTNTNQDLHSLNRKYRDQNSTLSNIYSRVAPYFNREEDKDAKDKVAKTESSGDKDKKEKLKKIMLYRRRRRNQKMPPKKRRNQQQKVRSMRHLASVKKFSITKKNTLKRRKQI